MTAYDIENMSLIMEEEIVNFISNMRDPEKPHSSKDEDDMSSAHVQYMSNEALQASIDYAEVVKSCSEDNPISKVNITKIRQPLVYKTMNSCK